MIQQGRLFSSKEKDNDKSQAGPSSQKSKRKGPKNSESDSDSEVDLEGDPPIQNMRNPNPGGVPPNMRVGMNTPNFRGPSNPIRPQNPQPMRPTMQNRGIGGNPNFGPRMNNPNLSQQGPQFRGNPQFGGPSTFGQSTPYNAQMLPNPGRQNMPPQYMPQPIVPYTDHGNYNPGYTPQPAPGWLL
uniref:Uncharacterized protein n=1 Tax=Meloidogyne javanica TaxID=6303 RepID=A0A915N2J6_MELJA